MWHDTVAELYIVFTQLSEVVAPSRVAIVFKRRGEGNNLKSFENWLALLVLAFAISSSLVLAIACSSSMHTLFGLLFVTLAHGWRMLMRLRLMMTSVDEEE